MIAKHITVALIGSALLATGAAAQTAGSTNTMSAPAATSSASGYHGEWRSSEMIGLNVYNDSNEKLGSISDMLLDKSGKINAAVIGVGGFLGVGEHLVAVSFDKLKFVDTPVPSTSTSSTSGGTTTGTTTGSTTSTSTTSKSNPWYPDHVVFSATKEQLKSMPEFKYSE